MFCKECGAEIPDDSKHCKECGANLVKTETKVVASQKKEKSKNGWITYGCCIGLVIIFLFTVLFIIPDHNSDDSMNTFISNGMNDSNISEADFKEMCTPIDYNLLTKNSNNYLGNRTVVSGTVLQIMEDDDGGVIRLATDGSYDDVVAIFYSGSNDVVDGDYITVYGYVYKDYSYESQANMHITIPCISAKYIDK